MAQQQSNKNSPSNNNGLNALEMEDAIVDLQEAVDHLNNVHKLIKHKNTQIRSLQHWVDQLIKENENLKSTVEYLTDKSQGKNYYSKSGDELVRLMTNTFKETLSAESSEKEVVLKLLKRLDSKIEQVFTIASLKSVSGISSSELIMEMEQDFLKIRTALGARLFIDSSSSEAQELSKYFTEKGLKECEKKDDVDTKMDK